MNYVCSCGALLPSAIGWVWVYCPKCGCAFPPAIPIPVESESEPIQGKALPGLLGPLPGPNLPLSHSPTLQVGPDQITLSPGCKLVINGVETSAPSSYLGSGPFPAPGWSGYSVPGPLVGSIEIVNDPDHTLPPLSGFVSPAVPESQWDGKVTKPAPMKAGSPDDFQTDPEVLDCLAPFLKKNWWIWECACGKGQLVGGLRDRGFHAFGTDLYALPPETARDFLSWCPKLADAIVTNPPYSRKSEFLERAIALGKPFAFLMRDSIFDSKERRKLLKALGKDFGMVIPPKRPTFTTPVQGKKGGSWFAAVWICGWMNLPSQVVFPEE